MICIVQRYRNIRDWARTIHIYRSVLQGILATLFDTLGLEEGETSVGLISRRLYSAVLRELQPVEAAVRRLIVLAARGLVAELKPSRSKAEGSMGRKSTIRRKVSSRRLAFPLFDRRKHSAALDLETEAGNESFPSVFDDDPPAHRLSPEAAASPASPLKGRVDSSHLCQRLKAVMLALEDIPAQAKRLIRLRARRSKVPHLKHLSPLRLGRPPGLRRKAKHKIDQVLREIHDLAFDALRADTS